jgi:5'-nucleotidase
VSNATQRTPRRATAGKLVAAIVAGAGLTLAPLAAVPAQASTDGTGVVINEVYLSAGSAGAAYKNKFVELYNPGDTAVELTGWSVQYRSATGTSTSSTVVALTGSIAADGYYLVAGGSNGDAGADLPAPDVTSSLNASGTKGTLILADTADALTPATGSVTGADHIIDLLGYGTSNTFEGAAAPAPSSNSDVKSINRTDFADTDSNQADFSLSQVITPHSSTADSSAGGDGGDGGDPGTPVDPPTEVTPIADIQGTTDVSPVKDTVVKTDGVVTAAYATGGFDGYYIQTPGTGGAVNLGTHTASDGLFVYSPSTVSNVSIGDYIEVAGTVTEFYGMTELNVTSTANVAKLAAAVTPPTPASVSVPATAEQRESLEGMLVAPQGDYTVTDNYSLNQYGEIGLAVGDRMLVQPTEVARPSTAEYDAAVADNAARAVTLDDGASTDFLKNASKPLPYLTASDPVRVGSSVTFTGPVIFDYRNDTWKLQPTSELTPANAENVQPATFSNTRTTAPEPTDGDLTIGTFNVLNYFPTTGDSLTGCSYYTDRDGNPITVKSGCDARGAANAENLQRQQSKIVSAINSLGADVVSLEEIENSAVFNKPRDFALSTLVDALNAGAGSVVWAFVPSPAVVPSGEDVIRTAFIYKIASVELVGDSTILTGASAFDNARQPLAQAFKPLGAPNSEAFIDIVNHFKSKGSGSGADADQGDGQGASNASRVAQARALVGFADAQKQALGIDRVVLAGDFNAYLMEDPIKVLTDAGYVDQVSTKTDKYTYAYGGTVGSLDHVFASADTDADVTGVDVWNINSVESVALEYSRYNYNVTNYYAEGPYRSSDHDPVVFGLDLTSSDGGAPGVEPSAASDDALTHDNEGGISIQDKVYHPKDTVVITMDKTLAGTWVSVWLHSTPLNLGGGWLQVADDGTVRVTLPADVPLGAHRLAVQDADGGVIGWTGITIAAAPGGPAGGSGGAGASGSAGGLAATGSDASPMIALGGILAALGLLAMVAAARIRRSREG